LYTRKREARGGAAWHLSQGVCVHISGEERRKDKGTEEPAAAGFCRGDRGSGSNGTESSIENRRGPSSWPELDARVDAGYPPESANWLMGQRTLACRPFQATSDGCTCAKEADPVRLPLTGGCMCGAARYQITQEPIRVYTCPLHRLPACDGQRVLDWCSGSR
jgi:hypothetical protein